MQVERLACHFAALVVVLFLGLSAPLFAQVGGRHSSLNPNTPAQREMQSREWALTHIPEEVNKHFKKEQISLFAEIREDFTRLQIINNEMMQTVFVKGNVDRELIAATTAEINKRAMRLDANLALPKIDDKVKNRKPDEAQGASSLQVSLLTLDRHIMSFVTNPLFKQPKVVDAQNALKARDDLNLIIRLSERLKSSHANQPTEPKVPAGAP